MLMKYNIQERNYDLRQRTLEDVGLNRYFRSVKNVGVVERTYSLGIRKKESEEPGFCLMVTYICI